MSEKSYQWVMGGAGEGGLVQGHSTVQVKRVERVQPTRQTNARARVCGVCESCTSLTFRDRRSERVGGIRGRVHDKPVFGEQTAQHTHTAHPNDLHGHTCVGRALALTVAGVAAL